MVTHCNIIMSCAQSFNKHQSDNKNNLTLGVLFIILYKPFSHFPHDTVF